MQKRIEVARVDHGDCLLLGYHFFIDKIAGDAECRLCRALAVAGLEHIKLAILDRELHVLHISVMLFEGMADVDKFFICLGHDFF